MKKPPLEMIGEATFVGGLKVIALYNDDAKLSAVYRVTDADVVEFDGPTLIQVRAEVDPYKGEVAFSAARCEARWGWEAQV